jgi:predicted signal transduction protein with EAL and GGDEF domain
VSGPGPAGVESDSRAATPPKTVSAEAAFVAAVRRCIQNRTAESRSLPILIIDTGVIASVDDVWGYQFGNIVRERIFAVLRSEVLRADDPLTELGRGKLACVLTAVDDPSLALLAAEKTLRMLGTPFLIGEDEIYACPAIGIAMWPAHGKDVEMLLHRARTASLVAGKDPGHIAMYAEDQIDSGATRFLYENRLRGAVADDSLDMWFQPQYDLRLGNVMGAEGMLRSRDPRIGLVSTVDAFAAAESAGQVTQLVSSMLNRALRNCSEFRYSAGLNLRVGVNLPARVLAHRELPDIIERALGTWSLGPGRLALEICETSVLANDARGRDMLGKLDNLGVRLAIDDPALSMSSMYWLSSMPFRSIKIDVSGAPDLGAAQLPMRITQSLIELGHHLKLDVYAIGAADETAEARLKELGCDYSQSDRRGPPLEAKEFVTHYGLA